MQKLYIFLLLSFLMPFSGVTYSMERSVSEEIGTSTGQLSNFGKFDQLATQAIHGNNKESAIEKIQTFLASIGNKEKQDTFLNNTMLTFVKREELPQVQLLVEHFDNNLVHAVNAMGETALMKAASGDDINLVNYLVGHGANVNAVDATGNTALLEAARLGNKDIANYLIAHNANVNASTKSGETPLMYFAAHGYSPLVKKLIDHGAEVGIADNNGNTVLMYAARKKHHKLLNNLFNVFNKDKKAIHMINAVNKQGKSALDIYQE